MYYKPVLSDGTPIPMPWQLKTFYVGITWPLQDNPTILHKILGYFSITVGFFIFVLVEEGEILYILDNRDDFEIYIEAVITCVVLNECFLRVFSMALFKDKFKKFLKEFFLTIYIHEKVDPKTHKRVRRGLIPSIAYSYTYIVTMTSFFLIPLYKIKTERRALPYKITPHLDLEVPIYYLLTLGYLYWIGIAVTFCLIGEAYLLACLIIHLNARYINLQEDIEQSSKELLEKVPGSRLAMEFRRKIFELYARNCQLDRFSNLLENTYSFRIFVTIAFSAVLLCCLTIQVSAHGIFASENIAYVFWTIGKISELLLFGELGSTLIQTTDKTSTTYYLSNWEEIVYRSTDSKANLLLMKDLHIIMCLNQAPKCLTGFNFFNVSLDTVVMVLRAAFSYYTCLHALH